MLSAPSKDHIATTQPTVTHMHARGAVAGPDSWCKAPALPVYGAKHHSIASLDPNLFNTLNIFPYIKKTTFPYLTNVGPNSHTKNEQSKGTR